MYGSLTLLSTQSPEKSEPLYTANGNGTKALYSLNSNSPSPSALVPGNKCTFCLYDFDYFKVEFTEVES